MNYITAVLRLLPFIYTLVQIAEKLFGPGEGVNKKALVIDMARGALEALIGISTGDQKELWQKLEPAINAVVDAVAGFLFPHSEDK